MRRAPIPKESTIFEGHFPGYPLMPGVLLIECMAQTTGWLVCMLGDFTAMPFLAGVKEAKFRTLVFPGDALEFEGGVVHEGSGYAVAECKGLARRQQGVRRRVDVSHQALSQSAVSRSRFLNGASGSTCRSGVR